MSGWTVPGYTEIGPLGSGVTGRVVAAVDDGDGTQVAIKYLSAHMRANKGFVDRFRSEAVLLADLRSPNVVRLHDYVETETEAAVVMELVDGVTLKDLLKGTGAIVPEAALAVMRGSLLGLAAAHEIRIVHRDFKSANVLIDASGESKLADLGIADRHGAMMPTSGTPAYMAPEQWEGAPALPGTDIYAATVTLFECLTGKVPYAADTLFELQALHRSAPIPVDEVPREVQPLVERGLAKDSAHRPDDAMAFVAELDEIAAAAYGADWEQRGRRYLAGAVGDLAALFPLVLIERGASGSTSASSKADGKAGIGAGSKVHGRSSDGSTGTGTTLSRATQAGRTIAAAVAVVATIAGTGAAIAIGSRSSANLDEPSKSYTRAAPGPNDPTLSGGDNLPPDLGSAIAGAPSQKGSAPTSAKHTSATATGATATPTASPTAHPTGSVKSTGPSLAPLPTGILNTTTSSSPVTSAPPPPPQVSVVVTAINGTYSGTCAPIPATATTFQVSITVTGTVTGSISVPFHWQAATDSDSDPTPATATFTAAGTQSFSHNESFYNPATTTNDLISVAWTDPGGTAQQSNAVPVSITCTTSATS